MLTCDVIDEILQNLTSESLADLELCTGVLARAFRAKACFIIALGDKGYTVIAKSGEGDFSEDLIQIPIEGGKTQNTKINMRRSVETSKSVKGFIAFLGGDKGSDEGVNKAAIKAFTSKEGIAVLGLIYNLFELHQMLIIARTDKLTGALNRRYMDLALEDCFERAQRTGTAFSVIMVDLDYFKHVNDTYGHLVGDDVLRDTSEIIRKNLRKGDILGRYGGEEFIVMLIDADSTQACKIAEKLRTSILDAKILGNKRDITASLGVATFPKHADSVKTLVDRADKALYRAKQTGRNKHELWDETMDDMVIKKDHNQEFFTGDNAKDAARIQSLYRMMNIAGHELDLPGKIVAILNEILTTIGATNVSLFLTKDKDNDKYKYNDKDKNINITDTFTAVASGYGTPQFNNSIIDEVLNTGNGINLVDWDNDQIDKAKGFHDWQSIAVAPAVFANKTVGVLYAGISVKTKEFKPSELAFLEHAATIMASLIINSGFKD